MADVIDARDMFGTTPTSRRTPGVWTGPQVEPQDARPLADPAPVEEESEEEEPAERQGWAPVRIVRTAVTHSATRAVARQAVYVGVGARVARRRRRDARSTARHERMMRIAEAAGKHEVVLEWETRAAKFKADRHKRRMALLAAPVHIAKGALLGVPVAAGLLLLAGILSAIASRHPHDVIEPFIILAAIVHWLIGMVVFVWGLVPTVAPFLTVAALWELGRTHADSDGGGWMAALKPPKSESGMIVTADGIVRALRHLGESVLNTAFKEGWMPLFPLTPIREGNGYRAIFELPLGILPADIADKRDLLARNLGRSPIEVWPSDAAKVGTGHAGCVDLWVANVGALSKPAPEYPLLHEGTTDVFEGVPIGVSPRGEALTAPVNGNNGVFGGRMGQGKSNAVRVEGLGVALDPLAEMWVFVFAGNGDFDAYEPRLSRYRRGATDDVVEAGVQSLRELYDEVGRRETRLAEIGAKKVTREIAKQYPDLRPLWVAYSECHVLFGHKEFGDEAEEFAVGTLRRARKAGIKLVFDTQSSRANAIPGAVIELMSVNACFSVKNWRSNDGFLGDGSFAAGIRATELRPGKDRGTSLITGVTDEPYEICKWYFIEVNDDTGYDAAAEVIARAMGNVDPATPVQDNAAAPAPVEERDLLEDILAVLGSAESQTAADAARLLKSLAPRYRAYQKLNGKSLVSLLSSEHGIKVPSTAGLWPITPALIRKALSERVREPVSVGAE